MHTWCNVKWTFQTFYPCALEYYSWQKYNSKTSRQSHKWWKKLGVQNWSPGPLKSVLCAKVLCFANVLCANAQYTNEIMCLISGTWHGRTNAMVLCGNGKKSKILDHAQWSCCVYSGVDEASKITPRSFAIRAVCHQLHPAHDQCTVTVRHLDLDCVPNMALQRGVVCSACNAMHTRHRTFW